MSFSCGHALLIGVGAYQYAPGRGVPETVADVQTIADVLRDVQHCGYPEAQVTPLCGIAATQANVLRALDELASRTTERDTVLLFYSGHGHYDDNGVYSLTTYDTQFVDDHVISGTAISHHQFLDKLRQISSKRMLLIFNACHAGAISPTLGPTEALPSGKSLPAPVGAALLATGQGRIIITACRETQYSFVGTSELTIFGQAVVDALHGKGTYRQHTYISAFDLYTYVYFAVQEQVLQQVPQSVLTRYGGGQEPELTVLKGVGPFAVGLRQDAPIDGALDDDARLPIDAAVREVTAQQSQTALHQLHRDTINQGSQNVVAHSDRDMGIVDKRGGVFVSGGTFHGPVVGDNKGVITATYGSTSQQEATFFSVAPALEAIRQTIVETRQQGNSDLADDLADVVRALQASLKAATDDNIKRRTEKLRDAQQLLLRIAEAHPELLELAHMLTGERST